MFNFFQTTLSLLPILSLILSDLVIRENINLYELFYIIPYREKKIVTLITIIFYFSDFCRLFFYQV